MALERGAEVHVWLARVPAAWSHASEGLLDEDERARCPRGHTAPARAYVAAHALLRTTLSLYTNRDPSAWRFRRGPNGRPEPADTALRFSLTHSHGLVACAIASRLDVGIDVEDIGRRAMVDLLAPLVLSAHERAALGQLGDVGRSRRFVRLWTLKEAYMKGLGMGLAHPSSLATARATTFAIDGTSVAGSGDDATAAWQFATFSVEPSHALSVAVRRGPGADIVIRRWWSG